MNIDNVHYIDNYAIITDKKLHCARSIAEIRKDTPEEYRNNPIFPIDMSTIYKVLSYDFDYPSIEEAIKKAKKRKWKNGVNIIAITEHDFEDNGFVVARVLPNGKVDTMEDLL